VFVASLPFFQICCPNTMQVAKIINFKKHLKLTEDIAIVSQLGLTMAGSILFCFAIGYYLDKWLNTKGLFITLFILLGIMGGGYTVYRQIMEITQKDGDGKPERGS
jgi:ATP synthase protein I